MIKVHDENIFFEGVEVGDSFRPMAFTYIIIYGGHLSLELNGVEITFRKGTLLLISPAILYKIKQLSNDLKFRIISLNRSQISEKFNFNFNRYQAYRIALSTLTGSFIPFSESEFQILTQIVEQIAFYQNKAEKFPYKEDIMLSLLVSIVYIVSGKTLEGTEQTSTVNSRKDDITIRFIDLVAANYKKEKELKFYADQLLISIKYLSNCIREITKLPPSKFISDAVINEAKLMLLNSKITINMIASDLGFSDQYAFGKFFKKHTGLSPKVFKQQNKLVRAI